MIYASLHTKGIILQSFVDPITWNFSKFEYTLHSPQVKLNSISSIKNLIYELPDELPNDLWFLGNKEILVKSQNSLGIQSSVQFPLQK